MHPDANLTDSSWVDSPKGVAWKKKGEDTLPFTRTLVGGTWSLRGQPDSKKTKTCEHELFVINTMNTAVNTRAENICPCTIQTNTNSHDTFMLLDTGALDGSYVSSELASILKREGGVQFEPSETKVFGATGRFDMAHERCCLQLNFHNEMNKKQQVMQINALIINTKWPIIIGRIDIKKHALAAKLPSQFTATTNQVNKCLNLRNAQQEEPIDHRRLTDPVIHPCKLRQIGKRSHHEMEMIHEMHEEFFWEEILHMQEEMFDTHLTKEPHELEHDPAVQTMHISDFLEKKDDSGINWELPKDTMLTLPELGETHDENLTKIKIFGSDHLQTKVKQLIAEYKDVFAALCVQNLQSYLHSS